MTRSVSGLAAQPASSAVDTPGTPPAAPAPRPLRPRAGQSAPKSRFEAFRRNNGISVTRLYRTSVLAPRTVDLLRRGGNPTIDTIRSITKTFSDLLGREVTAVELFDLTGMHQVDKVIGSFDLPGKKRRGQWSRRRSDGTGKKGVKAAKKVGVRRRSK